MAAPPTGSIRIMPSQPIHDIACAYFMKAYIPHSAFVYLVERATPSLLNSKPLPAALQAAAFACFSLTDFHFDSHETLTSATRRSYVLAITETNAALANPATAKLDSTLIATLLLGLIEAAIFRGRNSPSSWMMHTEGAMTLVRLRGKSQLSSTLGRELLSQTGSNIRSTCLLRGIPVPAELRNLQADILRENPADLPASVGAFVDRCVEIRIVARSMMHAPITEQLAFLDKTQAVDAIGEKIGCHLPTDWFEVVPVEHTTAPFFQGLAHNYPNHHAAKLWMSLRMLRLYLSECIWNTSTALLQYHSKDLGENMTADIEKYRDVSWKRGQELAVAILAAVDYFLKPTGGFSTGMVRQYLIWPLSLVGECELCTPAVRGYVLSQLWQLVKQSRLTQAAEAARMLEEAGVQEDWLNLYHVS